MLKNSKVDGKALEISFYLYLFSRSKFIDFVLHHISTVPASSVATKPILCTESPNCTMLFYYIKMQTSSSPSHPFLQLTGALK